MKKTPPRGRPPKPVANKKSRLITIKVTAADYASIRERAEAERLSMTDYLTRRGIGL